MHRTNGHSPDSGLTGHPRQRLLCHGPDALSSRDLLSLLITSGQNDLRRGAGPTEAKATELLRRYGSLRGLAAATVRELEAGRGEGRGLGRVSALRVVAALALGQRLDVRPLMPGALLRSSGEIFEHFHARLRGLKKERFLSILLDGKNRVIREELVSEGILTASLVHPREVFYPAIREAAGGLVLVHNHPSGDPEPSPEDLEVTNRLCAVGDLVGIRVLDHVVIGDGRYVSFLERGLLPS